MRKQITSLLLTLAMLLSLVPTLGVTASAAEDTSYAQASAMFNVNAGRCLDCAPWESEYPSFCHHCGVRLREPDACFCPVCGARLQVGGTDGKEEATK